MIVYGNIIAGNYIRHSAFHTNCWRDVQRLLENLRENNKKIGRDAVEGI